MMRIRQKLKKEMLFYYFVLIKINLNGQKVAVRCIMRAILVSNKKGGKDREGERRQ